MSAASSRSCSEAVAAGEQLRRRRSGAAEQNLIDELAAVGQPERSQRRWQHRGPAQHTSQRLRELAVRHGMGRHQVDRARELLGDERMLDRPDLVVDRDPAHVMAAAAQRSPQPEPERSQQLRRARRRRGSAPDRSGCSPLARRPRRPARSRPPIRRRHRPESPSHARCPRSVLRRRGRRRCRRPKRRRRPAAVSSMLAIASLRRRVPLMRLSRMRLFFSSVHLPAIVSPAR